MPVVKHFPHNPITDYIFRRSQVYDKSLTCIELHALDDGCPQLGG